MSITFPKYIRPALRGLVRTRAGYSARHASDSLLMDRNERVIPFPAEVMAELAAHLAGVRLNLYPEIEPFYHILASHLAFPRDGLFLTEGVSGGIKALLEALAPPGNNVVIPSPTFALYPVYAAMFEQTVRSVGYRDDFSLDLPALYTAVDDATSFVFLPNPNVPIEGLLPLDEIARLARHCEMRGAFLVLDEVYHGFGAPGGDGLVHAHPNVMVLRSFSKASGLAGIRLGYLMGRPEIIDIVARTRTGYESNSLSIECARFFIENPHYLNDAIAESKKGLAVMTERLTALGLRCNGGTCSNFLYVDLGDAKVAHALSSALHERGIEVRAGWTAPWDKGISITAADPTRMAVVADAIAELLPALRAR